RRQLPGQPDQFDVALAFPLQAPARRNPIKIAIDVELEHNAGVIAGSAGVEWLDADEPELLEIETVNEHVDRSHRVILGHIVIERCRKERALPAIQPFNKALHLIPRDIAGNLIARIISNGGFSRSLGQKATSVTKRRAHRPRRPIEFTLTDVGNRRRDCPGAWTPTRCRSLHRLTLLVRFAAPMQRMTSTRSGPVRMMKTG